MKKIYILLLCVLVFLLPTAQAFSQCMYYPVPLERRVANSKYIVQGKVIDKHTYLNPNTGIVNTLNRFRVNAWLKNHRPDGEVYIITQGGVYNGRGTIVTPSLQLDEIHEYILMLEDDNSRIDDKTFRSQKSGALQCLAYADAQGALTKEGNLYHDLLVEPPKDEAAMLQRLSSLTGQAAKKPSGGIFQPRRPVIPQTNKTATVTITGFSPNPALAGMTEPENNFIITGTGFGASPPSAFPDANNHIYFNNASLPGGRVAVVHPSDYVSWNDNRIELKIPCEPGQYRGAGTGNFGIVLGGVDFPSPSPLTINFSHFAHYPALNREKIHLRNKDNQGGYTFTYNNLFDQNTPAAFAFEKALRSWRCSNVHVNWRRDIGTTLINEANANDGVNLVSFGSLADGQLAATWFFVLPETGDPCPGDPGLWWLDNVDVLFKPLTGIISWQMGPCLPDGNQDDFESVALHELGHALGLGHVINTAEIMHPSISLGQTQRLLTPNAIAGGIAKMAYSKVPTTCNPTGSGTNMIEYTACLTGPQTFICQPLTTGTCVGSSYGPVKFTSNVAGATFSWTMDKNIGYATSGTGDIPSFFVSNTDNVPKTAVVTVKATANGVQGPFASFTITVNPNPIADGREDFCNGGFAAFGGQQLAPYLYCPVSGATFSWTCDPDIGFGTSGTTTAYFTPVNNSDTVRWARMRITATANGCTGPTITTNAQIFPTPIVNSIPNFVYNHGDAAPAINFSSNLPAFSPWGYRTSFAWSGTANVGFGISAGFGFPSGVSGIQPFTATNTTNTPIIDMVTVQGRVDPTPCFSAPSRSKTFTITVNPILSSSLQSKTNCACHGGSNGTISVAAAGGTPSYSYTIAGPTVNTTGASSGQFINLTAGTYSVTSRDAGSHTSTVSNISITEPSGTAPDAILSVADYTDNFFPANASQVTLIYQMGEIGGNPALNNILRITKQAGYAFSLPAISAITVGGNNYSIDNNRWTVDNSNPIFYNVSLNSGQQLGCGQFINLAIRLTRTLPNKLDFTLTSLVKNVLGELQIANNATTIILVGQ